MKMLKRLYRLSLCAIIIISIVLFVPQIWARYQNKKTGTAYTIDIPIETDAQLNTVEEFERILEDPELMAKLQDAMDNAQTSGFIKIDRNYLANSDLTDEAFKDLVAPDTADGSEPFFIIKFDDDREAYTIFTTPSAVPAHTGWESMVYDVYKTVFVKAGTDENGNDIYEKVEDSIRGSALGAGLDDDIGGIYSYVTDYWAYEMKLGEEWTYNVDLNLTTDNDPATNYDNQFGTRTLNGWFGYPEGQLTNACDGCTFISFTPDTDGTYYINVKTANGVRITEASGYLNASTSTYTKLNVDSDGSFVYTDTVKYAVNLTKDTTYYFSFQMPEDQSTALSYNADIWISDN